MEYEGHNGSAWYEAEAYRSVSQAAGRLLRHQNDYGALLLLDGPLAIFNSFEGLNQQQWGIMGI